MLSVRACCGGGPPAHNPQQSNEVKQIAINRRLANGGVLYTFATALIPAAAAAADLTPYERGFKMQYGLSQDGKIRGCPSDVNPNCVSSASLNDVSYAGASGPLPFHAQGAQLDKTLLAMSRSLHPASANRLITSPGWLTSDRHGCSYSWFKSRPWANSHPLHLLSHLPWPELTL